MNRKEAEKLKKVAMSTTCEFTRRAATAAWNDWCEQEERRLAAHISRTNKAERRAGIAQAYAALWGG